MFITKRHIPRRTFLKGMGVSIALPYLEAMLPAQTASKNMTPPTRYAFMYVPHGMIMNALTPAGEGASYEITPILTPLEPFRDQLHIASGLEARMAGDGSGGDHMSSAAAYLSGARASKNEGQNAYLATTIDQIIAQKVGKETPLPSLELGIEDTSYTGVCDDGYSCAYMNTISWATATKPLPMERNPVTVFERLFGDGSTEEQRLARRKEDRSILDSITRDVARLGKTVSADDRRRLDEYLDEIREIERRLQAVNKATEGTPVPETPIGVPDSWHEHVKLMLDMQFLAFKADLTRVSTFMYSRDKMNRSFPETGVTLGFHAASHHGNNPENMKTFAKVNTYHLSLFAHFLGKLKAAKEGDANLLDHSLILMGSTMSNGEVHDHYPLPIVIAGGASGRLARGRHVRHPARTPLTNLMLSLLEKADIRKDSFGDSTGTIEI
jgi:hypothetical protein